MPTSVDTLPWSSLSLNSPKPPWDDLRVFANAAAEQPDVRRRLIDELNALLDRRHAGDESSYEDLTDLAVPAVFALAAEKLDAVGRRDAAEFLIHLLYQAGEADDDFLLEVGERAAGRLGPAVLEPAMRCLETHGRKVECWFHVFALLQIAADADDAARDTVRKFCRRVIREAPDRFEPWSSIDPALSALVALHDVDSLPFLRTIQQTAQNGELAWAIRQLEGSGDDSDLAVTQPWRRPVEEWLPGDMARVRKYLEETEGEDEEDAEEREAREMAETCRRLVEAFDASDECAALPEAARCEAGAIAAFFLQYAGDHLGVGPDELSPLDVEEVLLDLFPRKVSAEREFFEQTPVVLAVFFDWLEQTGEIADAGRLKEVARSRADELLRRSQDRKCWGPAKSFVMTAMEDGVDTDDPAALQRYMLQYNARLVGKHQTRPTPDPSYERSPRPIVRETRKIGRNAPCLCGSGKKYKKCCGK